MDVKVIEVDTLDLYQECGGCHNKDLYLRNHVFEGSHWYLCADCERKLNLLLVGGLL
jgi:predicted SprT family Zn-dependent metalloprotease